MTAYFDIMNLLDAIATGETEPTAETIQRLDDLLRIDGGTVEDIADANDCGACKTWAEIIASLKRLHENGERAKV